ncbi:MAG: ribosome-recycling factor [bacterium]|nr:ribosome-recycling factor [bacterium]
MTTSMIKQEMEKVLQLLEGDLRTLRPGRASGELVGTLPVECYGSSMPLNQVASISANEQGQIIVAPFDKGVIAAIDTVIRNSQLGFSVVNEGAQLRLSVPPLSQERRVEMVKLVGQKGEAARIQLRQLRGDAHQKATKEKSAGIMREDELNRFTKEIDEAIGSFNTKVKDLVERKEKELMTV